MFKRKRNWIIIVVLIIAAGAAAAYYISISGPSEAAEEDETLQTTIARQGDITISATAAGTVIPATEIQLSFPTNGVLSELLVQVGDEVQVGDVLDR